MKTDNAVAQLVTHKEGRRLLSLKSPSFFAAYYMGLKYLKHQDRWLTKATELANTAKARKSKEKLLVLAPRGHGKSYLSLIHAVWRLCTDRNCTILIVSATAGQAEKRLKAIRAYLEDPKIIADWGSDDLPPFQDETTSWLTNRIYLKRDGKIIDPSVEAIGIGGAVTGAHVDIIILDDVEDSTTANSDALRRRSKEWLNGTLLPILNRGGLLLTIGTRKGSNDLYADMLADPTTYAIVDSAIIKYPTSYEFIVERQDGRDVLKDIIIEGEDEAEVLWPEERPLRFLLMELATVGSKMFAREMQNKPISDDDAVFKTEWVTAAQARGKDYSFGDVPADCESFVVGIDFALNTNPDVARRNDSDYTVLTCLAADSAGNRYLVDMERFRGLTPDEMYSRVVNFCKRQPLMVAEVRVERNSFGMLHALALKGRTDLPLREHLTTKKSKNEGIARIAVLLENGKFIFPHRTQEDKNRVRVLADELLTFPLGAHDDTVMSLSIAESALLTASFAYSFALSDKVVSDNRAGTQHEEHYDEAVAEEQTLEDIWKEISEGWTDND